VSIRPYSPASLATLAGEFEARSAGALARWRVRRARGWGLVGAGYLLFLCAQGWRATNAAVAPPAWQRGALVLGALCLLTSGVRALLPARAAAVRPEVVTVPADAVAPEPAVVFVGRLYALGPSGWALVVAGVRDDVAARAGARAVLCTVVADLRLERAERRLADAVAAVLLLRGAAQLPPQSRAIAHTAARLAALAVLVRPSLPARDFEALYAPFGRLIPAHTLQSAPTPAARSRP